jgi:hypothetical protein
MRAISAQAAPTAQEGRGHNARGAQAARQAVQGLRPSMTAAAQLGRVLRMRAPVSALAVKQEPTALVQCH